MPVFKLDKYSSIIPSKDNKKEDRTEAQRVDADQSQANEPVITIKGTLAETVYDSIVAIFSNYNKPHDVTVIATDEKNIAKDAEGVKLSHESSNYTVIYLPRKAPLKKSLSKESILTIDRHLDHIVFSRSGLEAFVRRISE